MDLLFKKGAVVQYNDPQFPALPPIVHYPDVVGMTSVPLAPDSLGGAGLRRDGDGSLAVRLAVDRWPRAAGPTPTHCNGWAWPNTATAS